MPEHELVCQSSEQEQTNWEALVAKYTPMVQGLAMRYTGNPHDAQDITQDVFLQSYAQLSQLRDLSKFSAWLRRITINTCHGWHRRQKVKWVPLDSSEYTGVIDHKHTLNWPLPQPLIVSAADQSKQIETQEIVSDALQTLSEKQHSVVTLYYLDGLSYQEIAEYLDVPLGTVKRRLHDARHKLKEEVFRMSSDTVTLKHAVGLETRNESHTHIFGLGMHLPAASTLDLSTSSDGQNSFDMHILQGDSQKMEECRSIAKVHVSGILPNQKKQVPQIKVTFEIDRAGAFHCRATELPNRTLTVECKPEPIETVNTPVG